MIAGCAVDGSSEPAPPEAGVTTMVEMGDGSEGEATTMIPDGTIPDATIPDASTTTSTTTTTLPEPETRCITVLKCQFAFLEGVDYSLLTLEFTDFSVARLAGASFVRANLKQAVLIRADLSGADMTGANLTSANLTGATVAGTDFTNANMTNTVICGVDLEVAIGISEKQLRDVQTYRDRGNRYCP